MLVPDVEDLNLIGQRLRILFYTVAFICVACFVATIIGRFDAWCLCLFLWNVGLLVFRRLPPTPPSKAQEIALQISKQNYGQTLKRLLTNHWFLLLLLSYGIVFFLINNSNCFVFFFDRSQYRRLLFDLNTSKSCLYVVFWSMEIRENIRKKLIRFFII